MSSNQGKVFVVTGGGSGIGRGIVLRCLQDGASVVVCDKSAEAGAATVEDAKQIDAGGRVRFVEGDVTSEETIVGLMDAAVETFGDLDCVVNNAGHGMSTDVVTELSLADWEAAHALLARAPFLGTKYGARKMISLGHGGSIVNMSSIAGLSAGAGPLGYTTFKAAVINFTRGAAVELAPSGIRVNSISPGLVLTPLTAYKGTEADAMAEVGAVYAGMQPLREHGRPEFIAAGVAFLASDDARWVTGHNLVIDGGNSINNLISERVYASVGEPA